jgi:hypothetical protein
MTSPNSATIDEASGPLKEARSALRLRGSNAVELILWGAVLVLLSPLVIYIGAGEMPLAALFGIAGGIALGLALAGRRLHAALLRDALHGRDDRARFLMTVGMALLVLFLVLLGGVVALTLLLRSFSPRTPV